MEKPEKIVIPVNVNRVQHDSIREMAANLRMPVSRYIREAVIAFGQSGMGFDGQIPVHCIDEKQMAALAQKLKPYLAA